MSVRVATADSFPYVCLEYVCACGATSHAHGRRAGSLPVGWIRLKASHEVDEADHVCPRCAAAAGRRAAAS